jgi:hypothetical protein
MDILKNCNILLVIEEGRLIALTSDVAKTIKEGILFAKQFRGGSAGAVSRP